jgi:DNA topoisomerase 2-associated protein PAT1
MKNVFPPLVRYISQSSFNVINPCMRIVLDRDNVLWLTKSRVSLAILTMLLSRSEILKQGGWSTQGLPPPTEAELSTW